MSHALRSPSLPTGLSALAQEFRRLDLERRRRGLSLGDASRYHGLFARLSDALAGGERKRRVDGRQFLRVPFAFDLMLTHKNSRISARGHDFGGGGCAIACAESFVRSDELWLEAALLGEAPGAPAERLELRGRAIVAWAQPGGDAAPGRLGLRFAFDVAVERDHVDRVFYRLLDRFLAR